MNLATVPQRTDWRPSPVASRAPAARPSNLATWWVTEQTEPLPTLDRITLDAIVQFTEEQYKTGSQTFSWHIFLSQVSSDWVELEAQWRAENMVPPSSRTLSRLRVAVSAFVGLRHPEIEVDPSDGELSLMWARRGDSVRLSFGDGDDLILVETSLASPLRTPVTRLPFRTADDVPRLARRLQDSVLASVTTDDASLR